MLAIRDEKGVALILVVALLGVLSVLAAAMVSLGRYETKFLVKERLSDAALYIADGGVEYAINKLQKDSSYRGPTADFIGSRGEFHVSVSTQGQPANHYEITSIGYVPDAASFRAKRVVRSVVSLSEQILSVFGYAIASQGDITLQDNAIVNSDDPEGEGDVYSGGNILLEDNAIIDGDALATETITTQENSTITGEQNEGVDPLDFPEIDTASYISEAQAGGTYSGDYVVTSDQDLGPLYIDGNLVIRGNRQVTLTGTVFVTGSVTLDEAPETHSITGSETLIAQGNITMQGDAGDAGSQIPSVISVHGNVTLQGKILTQGTVIYAPEGTVTIEGNPDVNGVVVGQTVVVLGSATVTRRVDLTGYVLPGSGSSTVSVVSWEES